MAIPVVLGAILAGMEIADKWKKMGEKPGQVTPADVWASSANPQYKPPTVTTGPATSSTSLSTDVDNFWNKYISKEKPKSEFVENKTEI